MDILDKLSLRDKNYATSLGDGKFLKSSDQSFESINPSTGKPIATVFASTQSDYEQVMAHAHQSFLKWRHVPAPKRGELVRLIGQALRDNKDALGSLVAMEMGKSKQEGDGEVQEMIDIADFAVGQSRMLYGLTMHSERPNHRMYEQWHPLGVVGAVTAFNFPVAVWSWNALIAAICGNTVVWKPSEKTPLCSIAVQNICNEVMRQQGYEGVFSLFIPMPEDNALKQQFVDDKRVALLSFTGSCAVGKQVHQRVAARMGRSLLELGGNNAIIVDKTADLNLAIPAIVFGAVGTAGQRCTTTRRLFVHSDIFEDVCDTLKNAYQQVTIGDPLDKKHLMGPLIDQQAVDNYTNAISQLKEQGGEVLFGGQAIKGDGFFVEPTLAIAENDYPIVQTETFAPILYVMKFDDLDEAMAKQNDVVQGLSSALFTTDLRHAERYLSASGSDCGLCNVNIGTSGAEIGGAFGGEKETGGGREAGSDSWKAYMRRQTNTINWGNELPLAQGIEFNISR